MFRKTIASAFILMAFAATVWGQGTAELDIIIRDFYAPANSLNERRADGYDGYYGFQEFDYSKGNNRECNANGATKGMVQETLTYDKANCSKNDVMGKEGDPDYIRYRYCAHPVPANPAPAKMCYGEYLQNWYTNSKDTKVINEVMTLQCNSSGLCEIRDTAYFPLDKYTNPDSTWGKQNSDGRNRTHNYGFTVAGSGEFQYTASNNDNFAFFGDDDMWVFIDGILVIDIGGVHQEVRDSIAINDIARARGWTDGTMHSINFFYAERQTSSSHLRLTFRLTNLSPSRFGAPRIKKASTTIGSGGTDETMIWVSTELDLGSIESIKNAGNFPIIIKKSDPAKKDSVNGYKLSSIEYVGRDPDDPSSYVYIIKGDVCAGKNDVNCNLTIGFGDSLSFNVRYDDLLAAGSRDTRGVTLPSTSNFVKSRAGIEATKVSWAPNTTQMNKPPFVPMPGDKNPIKPDFVDEWFTGNPNDGPCKGCEGGLPSNGIFPNITQIWDPGLGRMVHDYEDPNLTTNKMVHGFGKTGTPIPPNRAGELVLTAFPNSNPDAWVVTNGTKMKYSDWLEDKEAQKLFGLPPKVSDVGPYGVADPKKQADYGGYTFVKNGFPNESSVGSNGRIAPTRCISDLTKPNEPRINCLNFSLLANQPFQISVILYDQLGNFVTQYRETVTEKEFRSVVQGPNYPNSSVNSNGTTEKAEVDKLSRKADDKCRAPTTSNFGDPHVITTNGLVKVNVNIYPFSKDGRRFGNGVYIAKIDRVDLPYDGCMNNSGSPIYMHSDYTRYHAEQKFGWMRTKPSTSNK